MTDDPRLAADSPIVIVVHGICANRTIMWPLAHRLRKRHGFRSRTWGYPSFFSSIDKHAENFFQYLQKDLASEKCIHVVAHSMGSIVVRAALARQRIDNLGRVVFLSPPNQGTPIARVLSRWIGRLIPPTRELSDSQDSFVKQLKPIGEIEVGVIAARYDFLVPLASTHLDNEKAHVCVSAIHSSLLISRQVCDLTANFLRYGQFEGPL